MGIWDSEQGTMFMPWLLCTDELVQIRKGHITATTTTFTLICNIPFHLKVCTWKFADSATLWTHKTPKTLFQISTFQEITKKLYCFPLWSWKSDILEVQGLPLRVATRSHRSHSIYRNKLINHWYSYLPQTFNVLHSQGWQCDQKVRVVLQTVSDPTVACPPPV